MKEKKAISRKSFLRHAGTLTAAAILSPVMAGVITGARNNSTPYGVGASLIINILQ
jgi:hypothetical protein